MKARYVSILLLLFFSLNGKVLAQTTITLQPDAGAGKDALIQMLNSTSGTANGNYGDMPSFEAVAWTWSGDPGLIRCLLQFDLSVIPSNAVITDARLSLYNDPTSTECAGQSLSLTGSNAAVLQRITSAWDESTVTWNNQPSTTTQNEVALPQTLTAHQDYLNMDVLAIVNDMFQNPSSSFGFMIQLDTEQYYRSMIFASSDNADCNLHPKLEITYNAPNPVHVLTIKPDAADGKDAMIQMRNSTAALADSNYGSDPSFEAVAWTWSGDPGLIRGLLEFDLSGIPSNAIVTGARLSLYNNPTSTECAGQSLSLSGSNVASLRRITSPWNESTVTWNNQPATTTQNEVALPQSTNPYQDYLDLDVLNVLNDMLQNPSSGFGFMIELETEQYYRSMIFASSDNADCNRHPKLEITHTIATAITDPVTRPLFSVSPNPSNGEFLITWNSRDVNFSSIEINNSLGEIISKQHVDEATTGSAKIDLGNRAKGVYFLTLSGKNSRSVQKLVID